MLSSVTATATKLSQTLKKRSALSTQQSAPARWLRIPLERGRVTQAWTFQNVTLARYLIICAKI